MKRLIDAIRSSLGISRPSRSATQTMDPDEVYFTMPTLNDSLPAVDVSRQATARDMVIHEDGWRQLEGVSLSLETEIGEEIDEIMKVLKERSRLVGEFPVFSGMHVRKKLERPLPLPIRWEDLLDAGGVEMKDVAGLALEDEQGVIEGGFSIPLKNLTLFGIRRGDEVETLCLHLAREGGMREGDAGRISAFFNEENLALVHWPSATVLKGGDAISLFLQGKGE